jgi:hypothetical protein
MDRFRKGVLIFIMVWAIVSLAALSWAQTINVWYSVEKGQWKTVSWSAVTQLTDGDPLPDPADATLTYNVYAKNFNTQAVIPIASGVVGLEQEIILPKRARYLAGVEANLLYAGETVPIKSTISWSQDATVCQGGQTFGMKFQTGPKGAGNLR